MSKVEELLAKYKNSFSDAILSDIAVVYTGKQINKSVLSNNGLFAVINGGIEASGYTDNYNEEENTITISQGGASAGYVNWNSEKIWIGAHCYAVHPKNKRIDNRFLYFVLKEKQGELMKCKQGAGIPGLNRSTIQRLSIPLPHIKVQEEIVKILDSFTNLIDALNEELSLRQKQFEYYMEKLLTFDDEKPVKMNDIILNLRTGLNPRTHFKLNTEDANCFYITVRELGLFDIVIDDKTDKINGFAIGRINERSNIQKNDILFSGTGTIGRTALVKNEIYKWNVKEGVYVITPNLMKVNPRYFIYLLHSNSLQIQYAIKAEGGAVKSVSMKEFKSLLVHIPSLDIQQSIVSKLDAFESLISSLKEEIALRQKQYEYYREKLLTFE